MLNRLSGFFGRRYELFSRPASKPIAPAAKKYSPPNPAQGYKPIFADEINADRIRESFKGEGYVALRLSDQEPGMLGISLGELVGGGSTANYRACIERKVGLSKLGGRSIQQVADKERLAVEARLNRILTLNGAELDGNLILLINDKPVVHPMYQFRINPRTLEIEC